MFSFINFATVIVFLVTMFDDTDGDMEALASLPTEVYTPPIFTSGTV